MYRDMALNLISIYFKNPFILGNNGGKTTEEFIVIRLKDISNTLNYVRDWQPHNETAFAIRMVMQCVCECKERPEVVFMLSNLEKSLFGRLLIPAPSTGLLSSCVS